MKKFLMIAGLLAVLIGATSCDITQKAFGTSNVVDYIEAPKMQSPTIAGTWEYADSLYLGEGDPPTTEAPNDTAKYLLLDLDMAAAFNQYTEKPSYKSKVVSAASYSILKLRKEPAQVGITADTIEIVSVEGEERFYFEIIVLDPSKIMVAKDGFLHTFENRSNTVDEEVAALYFKAEKNPQASTTNTNGTGSTALLLGVKSLKSGNAIVPDYSYKTILLYKPIGEDAVRVLATQDLFVPRKNGFWTVRTSRKEEDNVISDRIEAFPFVSGLNSTPISGGATESPTTDLSIVIEDPVGRNITYINDTYISVDTTNYQDYVYTWYNTFTFDTLQSKIPLDIALIAGEGGKKEILDKGNAEATLLRNNNANLIVRIPETTEWGVVRRNGRWIFRSVVRAIDNDTMVRKGYDLHILTNTKVFNHNELSISWKTIKERHPSAIDAMTAPSQDLVIIQEAFRLYIYRIEGGTMAKDPISAVRIRSNDRLVMGEWANGSVADEWYNTFQTTELLEITQ